MTRAQTPPDADPLARPPDPFAGVDAVPLTVEEARAWTLRNNLDLRVALIDPTIANQSITEEEAAWQAVFFSNFRFTDLEQPTATTLVGGQVRQIDYDLGVRVPLRTGGEVTVRLPFNRTKTNNQFSTLNPSISSDVEFSISQPLLRNAGRRANTHALRVAALNGDVTRARTKLEVIRQLAEADRAFWRLYAARRALDVAQQQFELAQAQLERARRRVDAGDAAEIERVRAEEGVAQRLESIITAQNDVLLRQRELKRLINLPGLDLDTPVLLVPASDPDPVPLTVDREALMAQAIDNRMELLELELQLAIDESTVAFERNRALPLFSLDYTYRLNGLGDNLTNSVSLLRSADFNDWIVGLSFEQSVGNDAAKARVQRAILDRLQRLASREAREQSIRQEVLDAADTIESGWQRIMAAAQSSILAARTLQAEQRQFDVGRSTSTVVLDTATRLAEAQLAEIRAVTDYEIAKIDLAFATGTLLGADRVIWAPVDPRPEPAPPGAPAPEGSAQRDEPAESDVGPVGLTPATPAHEIARAPSPRR
ncbi:MAG: TolC family protein [Planctomycetota bacterium]|nr:MAG: TolC family protein [Planctomycetota bacterium]